MGVNLKSLIGKLNSPLPSRDRQGAVHSQTRKTTKTKPRTAEANEAVLRF